MVCRLVRQWTVLALLCQPNVGTRLGTAVQQVDHRLPTTTTSSMWLHNSKGGFASAPSEAWLAGRACVCGRLKWCLPVGCVGKCDAEWDAPPGRGAGGGPAVSPAQPPAPALRPRPPPPGQRGGKREGEMSHGQFTRERARMQGQGQLIQDKNVAGVQQVGYTRATASLDAGRADRGTTPVPPHLQPTPHTSLARCPRAMSRPQRRMAHADES